MIKKMIPYLAAVAAATVCLTPSLYSARFEIPLDVSQKMKPATIKVLLSKNRKSVLIEAKGHYGVYDPDTHLLLASGSSKKETVVFQPSGIIWGEQFADIPSLRFVPQDALSTILIDGIEYRGCVEVYAQADGLQVVNEVDIERYLKSTLTFCFTEELDNEVLEAVAISARTHAYYLMKNGPDALWHIAAQDAGYQGSALVLQNLQMEQAINNTRNMIMTFKGNPFPATWTKDSAGKTAHFTKIFRKDAPAPRAVSTPIAARERDSHMWLFEISRKELARIAGMQKMTDIGVFQDKDSHKVYALRFKADDKTHNIDFFTLQKALGAASLKSNDFQVEFKGDKVRFTGYGEGHGVGLCLLSAAFYADKGEKAREILGHFFPEVQCQHYVSN